MEIKVDPKSFASFLKKYFKQLKSREMTPSESKIFQKTFKQNPVLQKQLKIIYQNKILGATTKTGLVGNPKIRRPTWEIINDRFVLINKVGDTKVPLRKGDVRYNTETPADIRNRIIEGLNKNTDQLYRSKQEDYLQITNLLNSLKNEVNNIVQRLDGSQKSPSPDDAEDPFPTNTSTDTNSLNTLTDILNRSQWNLLSEEGQKLLQNFKIQKEKLFQNIEEIKPNITSPYAHDAYLQYRKKLEKFSHHITALVNDFYKK